MASIKSVTLVWALSAGLSLSGCATPPTQLAAHLPPPPAVKIGSALILEAAARGSYLIGDTMDGNGCVHLIVARSDTRTVEHVSIGGTGVISRETIRTGIKPWSVDIAFDGKGRLHALIDDEHFMRDKDGKWVGPLRTPVSEAKIDLARFTHPASTGHPLGRVYLRFIKGMPDLTWGFELAGAEMGLPTRTDLDFSRDGGIPIPSPVDDEVAKFVVVPEETPYRHWSALGMEDKLDVTQVMLVGDPQNVIHALYLPMMRGDPPVYGAMAEAAFPADHTCAGRKPHDPVITAADPAAPAALPGVRTLKLQDGAVVCPVIGSAVSPLAGSESPRIGTDFAALDPASGSLMLAGNGISWLVSTRTGGQKASEMPIRNAGLLLEPAGNGRFHALAAAIGLARKGDETEPVYYLSFENGAWSAPIEIGRRAEGFEWNTPPLAFELGSHGAGWGPRHDAFRIVSDDKGHALLIWPTKQALVGRWVSMDSTAPRITGQTRLIGVH
jgi:hypothetical protein